jgi:hypothetical protein
MILDQLLLGVLLVVTLVVLYMLYRFYSLIQKKGAPPVVKKSERPETEKEDTVETV